MPSTVTALNADYQVSDTASLDAAIDAADATASGGVLIEFTNDITEGATLDAINLQPGVTLTIDGQGHTLDGAGTYRGLFAYAGTIGIQNLAIDNAVAKGGAGGSEGAGGGAGLGGGLFVAGTNPGLASGAAVTLSNVTFSDDAAVGGAGEGSDLGLEGKSGPNGTSGGGGGLGGDGGSYDSASGGGGGIGGPGANTGMGGTNAPGAAGIVPGAAGGGASGSVELPFVPPAVSGGVNGGGGGGGPAGNFTGGGGGGVLGRSGESFADPIYQGNGDNIGGNGGFGGGGGGGSPPRDGDGSVGGGGNGGFGGGGGSAGGQGGFGGGSGAPNFMGGELDRTVPGGFGGGEGDTMTDTASASSADYLGGGGLGAGGAVFVQSGGSLTVAGGSVSGGSAVGGAGGLPATGTPVPATSGSGFGSGIYLQSGETLAFDEVAGQSTTVSDVITDDAGSGAYRGSGTVSVDGAGQVTLAANNSYSGGTFLDGGTLELASARAAGLRNIVFQAPATLQVDAAALANGSLPNVINGLDAGDAIDLRGLAYSPDAAATLDAGDGVLSVISNGATDRLGVQINSGAVFDTMPDSAGGTLVTLARGQPVSLGSGPDAVTLAISEDAYGGDAQFTVSIDGTQIGGVQTASALHGAGQEQAFTVLGDFGAGPTNVEVDFLNDAYAGTPDTDRNLYVDSITAGGTTANTDAVLYSAGPADFVIPAAPAPAPAPATVFTFNGGGGAWTDGASWMPAGPPPNSDTPGANTAIIPKGTVTLDGGLLDGITVQIGSTNVDDQPGLVLDGATLGSAFELDTVPNASSTPQLYPNSMDDADPTLTVEGTVTNHGLLQADTIPDAMTGNALVISLASGATLVQDGTVAVASSSGPDSGLAASGLNVFSTSDQPGTLDNEGAINVADGGIAEINTAVIGGGSINVNGGMSFAPASLSLNRSVASGQTVNLGSDSTLYLNDPNEFAGVITTSGSSASDVEVLQGSPVSSQFALSSLQFNQTGNAGGQLLLFDGTGQQVAALDFGGSYTTSDFSIVSATGQPNLIQVAPHTA